jgi:hypothetical protein
MHGEGMENLVITGYILAKNDRGRQEEEILDGVCNCLAVKLNKDIFRDVRDGTGWRNMSAKAFKHLKYSPVLGWMPTLFDSTVMTYFINIMNRLLRSVIKLNHFA